MSKQKRKLKQNKVAIDGKIYDVTHPMYAQLYEDKIVPGEIVWDEDNQEWITTAKTAYSTAPKWNPKLSKAKNDEIYEKWQKKQDPNYVANQVRKGTGNFAKGVAQGTGTMLGYAGEFMNTPLAMAGEYLSGRNDYYSALPNLARVMKDMGLESQLRPEDQYWLSNNDQLTPGALVSDNPLIQMGVDIPLDILTGKGFKTLTKAPKLVNKINNIIPTLSSTQGGFNPLSIIRGLRSSSNLADEAFGELLQGKKNRKSIAEGNKWLEEWIAHPTTQKKIDNDMNKVIDETMTQSMPATKKMEIINQAVLGKDQARTFKPLSSEYSLKQQLKENLDEYLGKHTEGNIHEGNYGASYMHGISPESRMLYNRYQFKPFEKYGSWISRSSKLGQKKRISTTIHEGTHDWIPDETLELSGQKQKIIDLLNTEASDSYKQWNDLRSQGKNPDATMDPDKAYQGYIANPTEVHARIMELRKHYNLKPDDIIDENKASSIIKDLNKIFVNPIGGKEEFLNQINKDPKKLAKLFNELWAVAPVVGATGAAGTILNQMSGEGIAPEQKAYGGKINNMKKNKLPKYQTGGPIDPNLNNRLMQYLFGRNTNKPSILDVRSPNEYGVSLGDRFNIQSGLSFDPMTGMPTGYGKVGINNKGFNLGLEKRKGQSTLNVGYDNPNFNIDATYSNTNKMPSVGGNVGFNTKGFNVGVGGNYSLDNKNISANVGYNNKGFNAGLNYDYSGQSSLSGNVGYGNDLFNVGLSGNYAPGDSNINLNTTYNLGTRKKQKAEPIPLAFNTPEEIQLIKEDAVIDSNEAAGPPKMSWGGKLAPQLFDLAANALVNSTTYAVTDMIKAIREPEQESRITKPNTGMVMANGGMIKRADGSYSKRGLWDNIRANKGSGKKPTKQMLEQERKIRAAEKAFGGMITPDMYMQQLMYGSYANGGEVPQNIPVEVEGGETYELPNGQIGEFEGPSHDNGGIPVALPEQTKVYSKQLKVNGKTMADRKTKREANVAKLEKILSKNPSDKFVREALKRQQETAALEEQQDMAMQEQANQQQQMQEQAQQGMMQEQAMAGLMQDPAMMQQMGMMMYGGKLDNGTPPYGLLNYVSPTLSNAVKKYQQELNANKQTYQNIIPTDNYKGLDFQIIEDLEYDKDGNPINVIYNDYNKNLSPKATSNDRFKRMTKNLTGTFTGIHNLNKLTDPVRKAFEPLSTNPFSSDVNMDLLSKSGSKNLQGLNLIKTLEGDVATNMANNTNPYDAMTNVLTGTLQNSGELLGNPLVDYNSAMPDYINTKKGVINLKDTPTGFVNPMFTSSSPDANVALEPGSNENKFMNFLNNAVDKTGDFFSGLFDKNGKPKKEKGTKKDEKGLPLTPGDRMGMAGTLFGGLAPMTATMLNRMMTPKNQNFFREYGAEGLRAMQEAQALSAINRDKQLADIKLGEEASRQRGRNSARGVNTLRAMDIASDITANQAQNQAYNSYAQQMMQLLGQKAQMENQQDQAVMQGEYTRDLADRQDVDQFYTNLAQNFASQSELMQKQGRDMNQAQYNKMILQMSPMFSKYGIGMDMRNGEYVLTYNGEDIDQTKARLLVEKGIEAEKKAALEKAGTTTGTVTPNTPVAPVNPIAPTIDSPLTKIYKKQFKKG